MTATNDSIKELNENKKLLGTLNLAKRWADIHRQGNYKVPTV